MTHLTPVERVVEAARALAKNKHSSCDCGADWTGPGEGDGTQWDDLRAALSSLDAAPVVAGEGPYDYKLEVCPGSPDYSSLRVIGPGTDIGVEMLPHDEFKTIGGPWCTGQVWASRLNVAYAAGQRSISPLPRPADEGEVEAVAKLLHYTWDRSACLRSNFAHTAATPFEFIGADQKDSWRDVARSCLAAGFRLPDTHNTKEG